MYTRFKSVQILISLLKQFGVRHLVLCAGQTNMPFVRSVETDAFFKCYSVVDERSAGFFALGLSQELQEPVAISCTAGTAASNLLSSVTEAFYQKVPLVLLTSAKDTQLFGQRELLSVDQDVIFNGVVKKHVQLPIVQSEKDTWYCNRLINEALLELDHHGFGPVHINIPTTGDVRVDVSELPDTRKITRHEYYREGILDEKYKELLNNERILVICGQQSRLNKSEIEILEQFYKHYNCCFLVEHMANIQFEGALNTFLLSEVITESLIDDLMPSIVISFGENIVTKYKAILQNNNKSFRHWLISEDGAVIDAFKGLTDIFECKPLDFFNGLVRMCSKEIVNKKVYYNKWQNAMTNLTIPDELPYSSTFIVKELLSRMPQGSLLHLSILNSIRLSQFFGLPAGVTTYANIGALGIDGSMSTFIGQSVATEKLSFMIIGDLSFLYDMNSLRIRHCKNNIRILLINNHGGAEFYYNNGAYESIDQHTSARHSLTVQSWVEATGFTYLSATTEEEYKSAMEIFLLSESDKPIVLEAKTEMKSDAALIRQLYNTNRKLSIVQKIKKVIKGSVGEVGIQYAKRLIKA